MFSFNKKKWIGIFANNKMINEMSFRSIREKRGKIVHPCPDSLYVFMGHIYDGKTLSQFISYIYLRCSKNIRTWFIYMNTTVISSNKIYSPQPEKNMHKVFLLKANAQVHRQNQTFLLTVADLLVYT